MKHGILFAATAMFALAGTMCVISCGDEEFDGKVTGVALATIQQDGKTVRVNDVAPGDNVTLTIGAISGQTSETNIVTISGITYAPDVHYYIDGQEVGVSNDYKTFFSVGYTVADLAPGIHTLSAEVPQIYNNITYHADVKSSTFNVVEK